jgi:hypothetical protein
MLIVNCIPDENGWTPIQYMVTLAAQMLEAQVITIDYRMPSRLRQVASVLNRRNRNAGDEACLMICAGPGDLLKIMQVTAWRKRFKFIAAWIIDSFWTTHLSSVVKITKPFDHFLVTSIEDVDLWKQLAGVPTTWLPWGADVLGCGPRAAQRDWDLTRVGRQPPQWDDDGQTARDAQSLGIKFRGRPARAGLTTLQNQRFLRDVYGDSKYILAFSNSVNPEKYTHPTRQYLTGRWVDSLGCGATVAGIRPRSETADELLWPGATLEFPSVAREAGLETLAAALASWNPGVALDHHYMALQKLDWRWRFETLAKLFRINPEPLANELVLLKDKINRPDIGPSNSGGYSRRLPA